MKRSIIGINILVITCLLIYGVAFAVPNLVSYQGKLNDQNGQPLNGNYTITFTIYDAPEVGNSLWTETWTGAQSVSVTNGLFSVELGSIQPLLPTVFDRDDLYLGIRVESDNEMTPRQRFTSGAYAFRAAPLATIEHYTANFDHTYGYEGGVPCSWVLIHSVTVPNGEIWEIHSFWVFSNPHISCINNARIAVDGAIQNLTAVGAHDAVRSCDRDQCSGAVNGFFSPPIKAHGGEVITIEGYCRHYEEYHNWCFGLYGNLGIFYYRKTP